MFLFQTRTTSDILSLNESIKSSTHLSKFISGSPLNTRKFLEHSSSKQKEAIEERFILYLSIFKLKECYF